MYLDIGSRREKGRLWLHPFGQVFLNMVDAKLYRTMFYWVDIVARRYYLPLFATINCFFAFKLRSCNSKCTLHFLLETTDHGWYFNQVTAKVR